MTSGAAPFTLAGRVLLEEDEIYRLSIDDFVAMAAAGIFEDERVELIDGVLFRVSQPTEAHSRIVAWLTRHFVRAYEHLEVRVQDGLEIERGYLSPDLLLVDPSMWPADPAHERLRHALLAVEVSQTSHRRDRTKALLYAHAGIPEYWIVDIPARQVVVHTVPTGRGYAVSREHPFGARLQPLVGGPELDTAEIPGG